VSLQLTNGFAAAQVGDILYGTNAWNIDNTLNDYLIQWTIPCGANLGGNCYDLPVEGSADDTGECTLCWRIQDPVDHGNGNVDPVGSTFHVHAYPFMYFGSLGGRFETWGVQCGDTPQLAASGRCGNSPVFDMRAPNAAIGLPERADKLLATNRLRIKFDFKKNCTGADGNIDNGFIDTYLHRIDKSELWPDGFLAGWGDLNKINENATEAWNLNFKFCLPETLNASQATGGILINTDGPITLGGRQWGVYVKPEGNGARDPNTGLPFAGKCAGPFFYVSFVPWSASQGIDRGICDEDNICIEYWEHLQFLASQEFKDRILGQNGFPILPDNRNGSGPQAHWPRWVWEHEGEPPFLVDAPGSFVLDGIGLGSELWQSPTNEVSCQCWNNVSFTSDRGVFGKTSSEFIPPDDAMSFTCTAVVSQDTECLPVDVADGDSCGLEVCVIDDCGLPVDVLNFDFDLDVAACNKCPCYLGPPLVFSSNSALQTFVIDQFADFSEVTNAEITAIDLFDISGQVGFDDAGVITVQPTGESPQCGFLLVTIRYDNCDLSGKVVCRLEIPLHLYDVVQTCPTLELCVQAGQFAEIPVIEVGTDITASPTPPLCQPSFGELLYRDGIGWIHQYEPGEHGTTRFVVPAYRNGYEAKVSYCEVIVTVLPPTVNIECHPGCRVFLCVKLPCDDTFKPVGKLSQVDLNMTVDDGFTANDIIAKEVVDCPGTLRKWSITLSGDLVQNSPQLSAFLSDVPVEVSLKRLDNAGVVVTLAEGKIAINSLSLPKSPRNDETFSISGGFTGRIQHHAL
jgi:hypothetical protein